MANTFSGLVSVAYSTDAFSTSTVIAGEIANADTAVEHSVITTDTTNSRLYGGDSLTANVRFLDQAGYAAMRTAMRAGTKYSWRFTFSDGGTRTSKDPIIPMVEQVPEADKRTGLNAWRLMLEFHSDDGDLTIA